MPKIPETGKIEPMVTTDTRSRGRMIVTGVGLAVFVLAYGWFLVTGTTEIRSSADPGAPGESLWAALLPALAVMALTRLIPSATAPSPPLTGLPRPRLRRETWLLVAAAVVFALLVAGRARGDWYPLLKVLLLLAFPLVMFRLSRGGGLRARAIPRPVVWLAPLPAVAAWFVLTEIGPFDPPVTQALPDAVTLAITSLVTLLTASVLEEIFYRGWLQTRLEVLYGRWPAITFAALLFAVMHAGRVDLTDPVPGLASIVAVQGVFGLMTGYLWARYRNIWIPILIHVVTNLVYVDLLLDGI
ncbi:lysostaphin resistance A-like protein [Nonomuraea sp. 10N515B]|uniref:lysostaphin resistance A-like protein n=1 Tax=Nonomuraea sp. 10N515B TaxID=3457422 RepID=UPI003FCD0484